MKIALSQWEDRVIEGSSYRARLYIKSGHIYKTDPSVVWAETPSFQYIVRGRKTATSEPCDSCLTWEK